MLRYLHLVTLLVEIVTSLALPALSVPGLVTSLALLARSVPGVAFSLVTFLTLASVTLVTLLARSVPGPD